MISSMAFVVHRQAKGAGECGVRLGLTMGVSSHRTMMPTDSNRFP